MVKNHSFPGVLSAYNVSRARSWHSAFTDVLRSNDRGSLQRVERFICVLFAKDAGKGAIVEENRSVDRPGSSTAVPKYGPKMKECFDNLEGAHPSCITTTYSRSCS